MKKLITVLLFFLSNFGIAQCEDFSITLEGYNPLCIDLADGKVNVTVTGETPPFELFIIDEDGVIYNPDNDTTTENFLLEGWYFARITDAAGCFLFDSILLVDPSPAWIESYEVVDASSAVICDGSIVIEEVGGPFEELGYYWSPDPDGISGLDANTISDLCPGTYSLRIYNEIGCDFDGGTYEIGPPLSVDEHLIENMETYWNGSNVVVKNIENQNNLTIRFFDMTGRIIHTQSLQSGTNHIDLNVQHKIILYSIQNNEGKAQYGKLFVGGY